jgi:hypothetical protein
MDNPFRPSGKAAPVESGKKSADPAHATTPLIMLDWRQQ